MQNIGLDLCLPNIWPGEAMRHVNSSIGDSCAFLPTTRAGICPGAERWKERTRTYVQGFNSKLDVACLLPSMKCNTKTGLCGLLNLNLEAVAICHENVHLQVSRSKLSSFTRGTGTGPRPVPHSGYPQNKSRIIPSSATLTLILQ